MKEENFGLIESFPHPQDFILGGKNTLNKIKLQENRDWSDFLPKKESQIGRYYDTYGCVSFSALNCLEMLNKRLYNDEPNYSDRYTVKLSGTVPNRGNTFVKVADCIRHKGTIKEEKWPHPSYTNSKYVSDYYKEVPNDLIADGVAWTEQWDFGYEWVDWGGVDPDKLYAALEYGPVQVSGRFSARNQRVNNVYQRTTSTPNHAITVYKAEYGKYWYIFDHYGSATSDDGSYTRKCSWDFYFGAAMLFTIKKKSMLKLVKGAGPDIFAVDKNGVAHIIAEPSYFRIGHEIGVWNMNDITEKPQPEIDLMKKGHPIVFGAI